MTSLLEIEVKVPRRTMNVEASFGLDGGDRLAIFGTSGAGKTTILETIAGFVHPASGSVRIGGRLINGTARGERPLSARERGVALVRQPTTLFPHLTVRQNVGYGARHQLARGAVDELLGRLGLNDLAKARASALSGGQRQRVALGRALASPFRVLLLDEPLSAVDVGAREMLRLLAIETTSEHEAAGILVTHDLGEAQAFADRLGVIDEGAILQSGGAHEVVLQPATRRVAELVGYGGFVPAPNRAGFLYAVHPDRVLIGDLADRGVVLRVTVRSTRPFGPRYECSVSREDGADFTIHTDEPPQVGATCSVTVLAPPIVRA